MPPEEFLDELRTLLANPAVSDPELLVYIKKAQRSVRRANYSLNDYIEQVNDTACQFLAVDGKFPQTTSATVGGLTTSFAPSDPEMYRRRIRARRSAMLVGYRC